MLRFSGVRWQVEPVKAESEQKIRRNRSWGKSGAGGLLLQRRMVPGDELAPGTAQGPL